MRGIAEFVKKETVLVVAGVLALFSCILVPPSLQYAEYVNYRVLILLFSLMTVVAGMKEANVFDVLSAALVRRVSGQRGVACVMVTLSFVFSMFLTNDVTLVIVVPFTLLVFRNAAREGDRVRMMTLIMETVAANLGSMLMPFGNPQNLFLYEEYHFSMGEFLQLMLPYTVLSLVLILALTVLFCGSRSGAESGKTGDSGNSGTFGKNEACGKVGDFGRTKEAGVQELQVKRGKFFFFLLLFICCLLSVGGLLPSSALLVIVLAAVLIRERGLLARVDYSLLLTFLFFFVFIGNIGNVAAVRSFLGEIVKGREVVTSILASQIVSNVPAAVLLAGFTENGRALVIGTNFGGLGTLIASMASLITYKFFAEQYRWQRLAYIVRFTAVNVLMLVLLLFAYVIF